MFDLRFLFRDILSSIYVLYMGNRERKQFNVRRKREVFREVVLEEKKDSLISHPSCLLWSIEKGGGGELSKIIA